MRVWVRVRVRVRLVERESGGRTRVLPCLFFVVLPTLVSHCVHRGAARLFFLASVRARDVNDALDLVLGGVEGLMTYEEAKLVREGLMHERTFLVQENTEIVFECVPSAFACLPRARGSIVVLQTSFLTVRRLNQRMLLPCSRIRVSCRCSGWLTLFVNDAFFFALTRSTADRAHSLHHFVFCVQQQESRAASVYRASHDTLLDVAEELALVREPCATEGSVSSAESRRGQGNSQLTLRLAEPGLGVVDLAVDAAAGQLVWRGRRAGRERDLEAVQQRRRELGELHEGDILASRPLSASRAFCRWGREREKRERGGRQRSAPCRHRRDCPRRT